MKNWPELFDFKMMMPEWVLAFFIVLTLIWGAFDRRNSYLSSAVLTASGFICVFCALIGLDSYLSGLSTEYGRYAVFSFSNLLRVDALAIIFKSLVVLGGILGVVLSYRYFDQDGDKRYELFVLMQTAVLGMMVMISANNFLTLYMGLELQSLSLYVLAAFARDKAKSNEAGLKYFILGALSSGLMLFGISLIYGFTGTLDFNKITAALHGFKVEQNLGFVTGVVMLLSGLAFKISAVPFHMWTPDVYQGAPTPVTAFFALAPKMAAVALFIRLVATPFAGHPELWRDVLCFLAAFSMLLGAFAALRQTDLKRLMAFSSIGHIGFILMGIVSLGSEGVRALTAYILIYFVMTFGVFACILAMRRGGKEAVKISDLSGLSKTHPALALCFMLIMFSMAGIPPLAGFFAKYYVIMAAVGSNLTWLAVVAVLSSVVAAYYYVNIIKIMYFEEAKQPLDHALAPELRGIALLSAAMLCLFVAWPDSVMNWAARAANMIYAYQ